jgi:hypothetical protein
MYDKKIDAQSALQLIRKVRPKIEYVFDITNLFHPDLTFLSQSKPKFSTTTRCFSQITIQDLSTRKGNQVVLYG